MYSLLKRILFQFDPEVSHHIAMRALQYSYQLKLARFYNNIISQPYTVMGLPFPNRIGVAAGLDKNAEYIDALAAIGFGSIEVGTITPKPQIGNPKPRLFRLVREQAIINRMGFNNKGIEYAKRCLEKTAYKGILGINIGKNKDTPLEKSVDDYKIGFKELSPFASYITINISSPNTPGLRALQHAEMLSELLSELKNQQKIMFDTQRKYVPLVVKIAPDLTNSELDAMCTAFLNFNIDGVIATNTTLLRHHVKNSIYATESGGLSGEPLNVRSTEVILYLHHLLKNNIPIIGSGGVMNRESAQAKINAGAQLLQVYSGFIFNGPRVLRDLQTCDWYSPKLSDSH